MNEDQLPEDKPENKAEEQKPGYGMKLAIFNSFEEMNDHDHWEMAQFTPTECLEQLNFMLRHFFKNELADSNSLENKIYF